MSDDLISRRTIKSLIETIRDCWAISPYVSADNMELYSKVFNVVLNEISNCPTAFDKGKVINEIRSGIMTANDKYFETCDEYYHGMQEAHKNDWKIVEKGGIE